MASSTALRSGCVEWRLAERFVKSFYVLLSARRVERSIFEQVREQVEQLLK